MSLIACCVTTDPMLNFDPWPQQRSVMRGSCLTQNGAGFRSQTETLRDTVGERERERERVAHRGLIYPLSLSRLQFFPSFAFSFAFTAQKLLPFLPIRICFFSLHPPHPPTMFFPSSDLFGTVACHHRWPPPQVWIHGNEDQQDSGRKFVGWGFNESKASSPSKENVCKWHAHIKRNLGRRGERRPSSCWAQRKMSGSGQKNDNKTPPPPFFYFSFFVFVERRERGELVNTLAERWVCRVDDVFLDSRLLLLGGFLFLLSIFICTLIYVGYICMFF